MSNGNEQHEEPQTETTTPFPARLHVLLAREARYGLVIRRGPSKAVCTIGWNRTDDSFTLGQWLRGRIYEDQSDLSPDGRHFIYFAMNGRWDSEVKGSWTALSRAPYFKAEGLWAKGDCWHGGGLFVNRSTYWLNDGYGHEQIRVPASLRRVKEFPNFVNYGGECSGVYYLRLLRDGWVFTEETRAKRHHSTTIFEKPLGKHFVLRKKACATLDHPPGKGCYYDEHEVENRKTGEVVDGTSWEWADVDGQRLVWASEGKLFATKVMEKTLQDAVELHDFNGMQFEPIKAPY